MLDLLAEQDRGLRMSDIQRGLGIPRPTVHRIVNTLLDHGYVVRDDDDRYHLGMRLYELGMRVQSSSSALDTIAHELEAIADDLDATSYLSVRRGDVAMCLARVDRGSVRITDYQIGETLPLTVGAGPKILLASMTTDEIEALLDATRLPIFTANTLSSRRATLDAVEQIRRDGYAVGRGDHVEIQTAIGVPLNDPYGQPAGAISVAMFQPRPLPGELEVIVQRLRVGAERLGRKRWWASEISR